MKRINKLVTLVLGNVSTENIPRTLGFFRPQYTCPVEFVSADRKQRVECTPQDTSNLKRQIINFHYSEGDDWLEGQLYADAYTGRTHVKVTSSSTFHSFKGYGDICDRCRMFAFKAVGAMGRMCFNTFIREKQEAVPTGRTVFTAALQKGVVSKELVVEDNVFLDENDDVITGGEETPDIKGVVSGIRTTANVAHVEAWPRRGGYVNRNGKTFWRQGSLCHRRKH